MQDFTPSELSQFPPGRLIADRYEVLETIGWGGMGLVLKARDCTLNNEIIALKILYKKFGADAEILARFRREVVLTRKLAHPNIVRVYDFGNAGDNTHYITMEYVTGETLKHKLQAGRIPFEKVIDYISQIGAGLDYAHSQGVVHRDIKPENMLVTTEGVVKISDFGVARSLISDEKLTKTDESVGSPIYIAPEIISSFKTDHRCDIYGLGVVAYELAEGRPPFFSEHWIMLAKMHMKDPVPPFTMSDIPPWYFEVLQKALAKEPEQRFQTIKQFIAALQEESKNDENGQIDISIDSSMLGVIGMIILFIVLGLGFYLM